MQGLYVTGTDTGVGKTVVATALVRILRSAGLRTAVMKPVASGCTRTAAGLRNADAEALIAASGLDAAYADVNPYAFEPPIAPHIAAEEAGEHIVTERIEAAWLRLTRDVDAAVMEGAGGWAVPLAETGDSFSDLPAVLGLAVVLVVGLRLGCLNHALLTAQGIRSAGLPLAGWVANGIDPQFERPARNIATLAARLGRPPLAVLPFQPGLDGLRAAARFDHRDVLGLLRRNVERARPGTVDQQSN